MTRNCTGSGSQRWFKARPPWPPNATNAQIRGWQWTEGLCDECDQWVPLRESAPGKPLSHQILADHLTLEAPDAQ